MSPATIGASASLDKAIRRAFSEAGVRLQPTTRITDVVAALQTAGVTARVEDGLLVMHHGDTLLHAGKSLRTFSTRPENESFFVLDSTDPMQWPRDKKIEFIRDHGLEEWEKKLKGPVLESGIRVLDANMDRTTYQKLTIAEKTQFISEFGADAVGRIMSRKC